MRLIDCFAPLISYTLQNQVRVGNEELDPVNVQEQFLKLSALCRQNCDQQDFSMEQREDALFAVIAWIDEQRLCKADSDRQWLHLELQKVLFNTSIAGDEFYKRFRAIPEQDDQLREVFAYCLILGFRGRMYDRPEAFADFCQESFGCDMEGLAGQLPGRFFEGGYHRREEKQGFHKLPFFSIPFPLVVVFLSVGLLGALLFLGQRSLTLLYSSLQIAGL